MAATPQCAPADACPGSGFVIDTDGNIQILGSTVVTFDADIHEGLFLDCARQAGQGQIFGWRANRRIYTAAERAALAGGNLFRGLRVLESDTMREYVYYGATTGWLPEWSLPWGDLSVVDNQTSTALIATTAAATETVHIASTAVQTYANRRYEVQFMGEIRNLNNTTAFASIRARRGINTAGTVISGPIGVTKAAAANSRQMVNLTIYDAPGAQAAQRWVMTAQPDAATIDLYNPTLVIVRDMGPSGSAPAV